MNSRTWKELLIAMLVAFSPTGSALATVVMSDSFNRSAEGTPVGTPPTKNINADTSNWVSDWGANNNAYGGYVTQTYTTYVNPNNGNVFFIDVPNGISGNWLNNGSPEHPLKLANVGTPTVTEPIGIPGFGWVQLNHNFAADSWITNSGKMTIAFDLYRTPGGNISWFFGNQQQNGQNNGNTGSPVLNVANDIGLLFRGFQSNTFGLFDHGVVPAIPGIPDANQIAYSGSPNLNSLPIPIRIEITGTDFSPGRSSVVHLWVAQVEQDLNGTGEGTGYSFTWDNGGAAYMGFGSNNTPVQGTVDAPVYRASGIDNLIISIEFQVVPGDYNGNNAADAADYVLWRLNEGRPAGALGPNDTVGGVIGQAQYELWRTNFGNPAGSGTSPAPGYGAVVPEPATLLLGAVGIGWVFKVVRNIRSSVTCSAWTSLSDGLT